MKIRLSELRNIIRKIISESVVPVYSTIDLKPGMQLRFTGVDFELPPVLKILKIIGSTDKSDVVIVAGDHRGNVHRIKEKDLRSGEFETIN